MQVERASTDISQVVSDVLKTLRDLSQKGGLACFDFTGSVPPVVQVVQRMLAERGYVTMVAITQGDPMVERVYVRVPRKTKVQ